MELLIVPLFLMALGTAAAVVEHPWMQWAYREIRKMFRAWSASASSSMGIYRANRQR